MPAAEPGAGQRVRTLALIDRIVEVEQELLAIAGDDPSIPLPLPTQRFQAEAAEAANLLRLACGRLRRAVGGDAAAHRVG